MVAIPKNEIIGSLIAEKHRQVSGHRSYIGASGLGSKCKRRVWLDFRWIYESFIEYRLARIFAHGDYEEIQVIADLESIGIEVVQRQTGLVDATGHIRGHVDGVVTNVPGSRKTRHLLEVKTMNDKRFNDYLKNGIKATNPVYWVQINMYMGWMGLERCLFIVTNKNNEERNYQRYDFDKNTFDAYLAIGLEILTAEEIPAKIGNHTYYECKFCDAYNFCHKGMPAKKTCRTCEHVNIEMKGLWTCGKHDNHELTLQEQLSACDEYKSIL